MPEIVFRDARCTLCRDCLDVCPTGALSLSNDRIEIDDERCDRCGRCEDACVADALEIAGKEMAVEQVMAAVEKDTLFYDQSGGGVTFSGGEPLLQPAFLQQLLRSCRDREIHTALDTTGYASPTVLQNVAPHVDLFLFDLKMVDSRRHRALTGVENGLILNNLRKLALDGHPVIVRVPIIPTINDDEENILAIGELAGSMRNQQRVDILPYHIIATEKYRRLRREYPFPDLQPPSMERMAQIASALEGFGLVVNLGG